MIKSWDDPAERWWDIWIAIFALATITLVAGRLWTAAWTEDLHILVYLSVIAGLSGLALGYSRFSPLVAALFSAIYGLFSIVWLFGTTVTVELAWHERIINHLWWRLQVAFDQFSANQAVTDPILFLVIMAVFLWIMAATATFILIRYGETWPVLIPLGMTLLVISQFDQDLIRDTSFLMAFIFFTLIIIGRMKFLNQQKYWHREGINISSETRSVLTRVLISVALVLVVVAWIIPVAPQSMLLYPELWRRITSHWDRFRDRFADNLELEIATDTALTTFFGESLALGSGTPTSDEIVFTVEINSPPPTGYRNYWYTRSYDLYEDGRWSTAPGLDRTLFAPDDFEIQYPQWQARQAVSYSFTTQIGRLANLYVAGSPTWIDRPVEVTTQRISETEEDLVALFAIPALVSGQTYRVESLVGVPTANALRSTDINYPEWLERYLQLPDDFSPRVAALAAVFGEAHDHPYDIAAEITQYLRNNIQYARTIPPVPPGTDPMEWFLFDEQSGFCNYYATAQVLMLRSLGIPARFVVGYAPGEYDTEAKTYTVRKLDSHTWPEVYFMDYGWVPFEPTASQPDLNIPLDSPPTEPDREPLQDSNTPMMDDVAEDNGDTSDDLLVIDQAQDESLPPRVEGSTIAWVILAIILVVFLVGMLILLRPDLFKINMDPLSVLLEKLLNKLGMPVPGWLARWRCLASMSTAQKAYRRLCRAITIMGLPLNPAQTPKENAQTLTALLPLAYQPALEIVQQYHLDTFSAHSSREDQTDTAGWQVLGLALKARLRSIFAIRSRP